MRCLFCKTSSGTSKSVEHTIPESLGNSKYVLPRGIVCDGCNNYFSVSVEAPILNHQSFRNLRGKYMIPSKKGKLPYILGHAMNTDIEVGLKYDTERQDVDIFPIRGGQQKEYERLKRLDFLSIRKNVLVFPMDMRPPAKEMSRFLAKMALETLCLRFSNTVELVAHLIDSTHFDRIRNWARYGSNYDEWPFHYRAYCPEETLMRHPKTNEWVLFGYGHDILLTEKHSELFFVISFHGHEFAINLGGPAIKGYEMWLEENNHVSALIERKGLMIFPRTEGSQVKYYLDDMIKL